MAKATKAPDRGTREVRTFPVQPVELREGDDGSLTFVGYAAVFNAPSEGLPFRERIMRGAFTESLASTPDVRLLYNHDPDTVMARTTAGNLTIEERDLGLWVEAPLNPEDLDVQRVVPKMRDGNVTQMSFAFWTRDDEWVNVDGVLERHLTRVDIDDGDVSVVTYPAYPATSADLRAAETLAALTHLAAERRSHPMLGDLSAGNSPPLGPVRRAVEALHLELTAAGEQRELNGWTLSDLYPLLYEALDTFLETGPNDPYYYWFWIRDVSDDWFVYVDERPNSAAPGMFQVPYTVTAEGDVELGQPTRVVAKTTYLPVPDVEVEAAGDAEDVDDDTTSDADETGDEAEAASSGDTPSTMTSVRFAQLRREADRLRQGARS